MVWGRAFQAEREECEPESQWGPQVTRDDGTGDTPGASWELSLLRQGTVKDS